MSEEVEHQDAIERMERSNRRYNQVKMFLTVVTLLVIVGGFWISNNKADEQRDRVVSCTTPEGECAQRNAKFFADAQAEQMEQFQRMLDRQSAYILGQTAQLLMKQETTNGR